MWVFGDGFDLYAAPGDAFPTYWDSGNTGNVSFVAGRFGNSRAVTSSTNLSSGFYIKSSGANDSVHHVSCAMNYQTSLSTYQVLGGFVLGDGATAQCSIAFCRDGSIQLQSGTLGGSVLATYSSAFAANTWYGFEFEVVIHPTAGSFTVRRNGNPANDFQATSLNTRGGTSNSYANRLTVTCLVNAASPTFDDFLWRSDPTSVPWVGDVRCYTRMPANDAGGVQFTPSGSVVQMPNFPGGGNSNLSLAVQGRYMPFVAQCDGTVGSVALQCLTTATVNIKCSLFASAAGAPTSVLGSANLVTNPPVGNTIFTFATPVAVTRGTTYYVGVVADAASAGAFSYLSATPGWYAPLSSSTNYASFPAANPGSLSAGVSYAVTINITPTTAANAPLVADLMQDGVNTFVSSSTVNQADLYGIATTGPVAGVIAVTTRGYVQKSDAGNRGCPVALKSGSTTVLSSPQVPPATGFGWTWRTDTVDPNTGTPWASSAVDAVRVGPKITF